MGKKKAKNPSSTPAATPAAPSAPSASSASASASASSSTKTPASSSNPSSAKTSNSPSAKAPSTSSSAAPSSQKPQAKKEAPAPAKGGKGGKKGKKGKKEEVVEEEEEEEEVGEVEVEKFEELQVPANEIKKIQQQRAKRAYFSLDVLEQTSHDVIPIHLFGSAAKVSANGIVEIPVGAIDSTLFVLMRIEKIVRVPIDFWTLVVKTNVKNKKPRLTFLNGSEMIHSLGLHKKTSPSTVYLLPSLEKDIDDFKEMAEKVAEPKKKSRPSSNGPHFFPLEHSQIPANLSTWEEKARFVFKLAKISPEDAGEEEEEDPIQAFAARNLEEETEEAPKILEIDDDANLQELDELDRKKKEAQILKMVDEFWEAYHRVRVEQHRDHDFSRQEEDAELAGASTGVIESALKNVDHILAQTTFSPEHKEILRHNIVVLQRETAYEGSTLQVLGMTTRIYSLVKNAAVDVAATFDRQPNEEPPHFHAALAFKLSTPLKDEEFLDLFMEHQIHRIPRSTGWLSIYHNSLDVPRRGGVYKEKRKMSLTRKNILDIRKTLFGNSKLLNGHITDYQLMKLILCSAGANVDLPHGHPLYFAIDDYFGYHLRLACKASTPEDDKFEEHNFEPEAREDGDEDYDDDDDDDDDDDYDEYDEYDEYDDYDDYDEEDFDPRNFQGDPRMGCPQQ